MCDALKPDVSIQAVVCVSHVTGGWCPGPAAPVGGVVHQAGPCNVAWVARGGFGQADWSPWALACSAAFGRSPLKNHLLRGHTHRSLCGGRRVTSGQASGFRAAPRPLASAGGSESIRLYFGAQTAWRSSVRVWITCTSGKVCLQSLPPFKTRNSNCP